VAGRALGVAAKGRIILATTKPGQLVADFFCGSGTTAVAHKLGRRFLAVDAEPEAIAITQQRLARTPSDGNRQRKDGQRQAASGLRTPFLRRPSSVGRLPLGRFSSAVFPLTVFPLVLATGEQGGEGAA